MSAVHIVRKAIPLQSRAQVGRAWRYLRDGIRRPFLGLASRSEWFAGIYYAFLNFELCREAKAVAAGQLRYREDNRCDLPSYFLLRRNTHRIEKGLTMRPRRPEFAADYIEETVDIFGRAVAATEGQWNSELVWADDVLTEYFDVVHTTSPTIAAARRRFETLIRMPRGGVDGPRSVPYHRDLDAFSRVDFDSFMALCRRRRSVRWFLDRPVPREMIDRALEAGAQAPSACNRQPFLFRIFDNREQARAIGAIPIGTKGFSQQFPAIAVLVGQLRAYPFERDRHAIYIDASLAAMSFMFALESMGLASCSINWPDQEPHESTMRGALNLEPDERVIMLIAFGWPDPGGMVPYSAKRPLEQLRRYEAP